MSVGEAARPVIGASVAISLGALTVRVHLWAFIFVAATLPLSGCKPAQEETELGFPDACLAMLSLFCISNDMSRFAVTIDRCTYDLHSALCVIKAHDRNSGELVIVASVQSLHSDEQPSAGKPIEPCELSGTHIADCERRVSDLTYEWVSPGGREVRRRGIRQEVIARRGVLNEMGNVALPCQVSARGVIRCGLSLPRCEIKEGTAGCA